MNVRKKAIALIAIVALICGFGVVIAMNREPDHCPLCEYIKSHAPCMVNIKTGEVDELTMYTPHHTLAGQLAKIQSDSAFSFVSAAGARGTRISSPYKMELKVPITKEPVVKTAFCKECRNRLSGYGHGFVLADLYDRGNPVVYAIEDGMKVTIRCYDISVTYNEEENIFDFLMLGTYHD